MRLARALHDKHPSDPVYAWWARLGGTTCKNVVNRMGLSAHRPYLVGLDCCDYSLLDYHTNESFYMMVDRLREEHAAGRDIKKLEQVFGLTYDEHGLLFDDGLRSIVKPVDNCIRVWMHTLVSGGIAGSEMALLMLQLHVNGISLDTVQTFVHFQKLRAHSSRRPRE